MQYVCLVYNRDGFYNALSPQEQKALDADSLAYDRKLESSGNMVLAHALKPERVGRIVQRRKGKKLVLDGPFTESKEQLIGFIVIEANSLDEAEEIGSNIPLAQSGTIVVRETYDFP